MPIATNPIPIVIVVAGRGPKAGASTIATELEACLAAERWSVIQASDRPTKPQPTCIVLSVAAVDHGRVCYLDRGAGPSVAGVIPEDDAVREAAALHQPTVIAFPDSAAGRALRKLADFIAAGAS